MKNTVDPALKTTLPVQKTCKQWLSFSSFTSVYPCLICLSAKTTCHSIVIMICMSQWWPLYIGFSVHKNIETQTSKSPNKVSLISWPEVLAMLWPCETSNCLFVNSNHDNRTMGKLQIMFLFHQHFSNILFWKYNRWT